MLPILLGKNLKNKNQNLIENRARFSLYLLLPFLRFVLAPESGSRRPFIMRIRIRNNFLLTIVFLLSISQHRLVRVSSFCYQRIGYQWWFSYIVLISPRLGCFFWPLLPGGRKFCVISQKGPLKISFCQKWLLRGFKIFCLAVSCFCLKKFCQKCILLKQNFLKIFLS